MYLLDREAAIRFLVNYGILDTVSSDQESRATVATLSLTSNSNGSVAHNIKSVSLRISKGSLTSLLSRIDSFSVRECVSALYNIGLALPFNEMCAAFWKKQSYGGCNCPQYDSFYEQLKKDVEEAFTNSYYLYDHTVKEQLEWLKLVPFKKNVEKCVIVYKSSLKGYRFHNLLTVNEAIMFAFEPRSIGAENIIDDALVRREIGSVNEVQYILRLGHLTELENYKFKNNLTCNMTSIAAQESVKRESIKKFLSQIAFVQTSAATVGYNGSIRKNLKLTPKQRR